MPWYVVLTKPRQEQRAEQHLQQQGIEVFLPKLEVEKRLRGKRTTALEPLFPGYLFIHLDEHSSLLSKVRSTLGVRQLLMFAGKIITVAEPLIVDLQQRCANQDAELEFSQGQAVCFTSGPFKDYQAVFKEYQGTERAIILLTLLNQQNELVVQLEQLAKK